VLISNKVNIWREIEQDGAGLVDEDDEPGVTRLLQKWLGLPEHGKEMIRRKALASFQARFEVKRAAESLIEVMQSPSLRHPPLS